EIRPGHRGSDDPLRRLRPDRAGVPEPRHPDERPRHRQAGRDATHAGSRCVIMRSGPDAGLALGGKRPASRGAGGFPEVAPASRPARYGHAERRRREMPKIGVLALQGAVSEHLDSIRLAGGEGVAVKRVEQLADLDGLIIPGGESTTIGKLMRKYGFIEAIRGFSDAGKPI